MALCGTRTNVQGNDDIGDHVVSIVTGNEVRSNQIAQ